MLYADVILPVPFETFTYAVPPEMEGRLGEGSHVLVTLGKSKHYAGVVLCVHQNEPQGVVVKPIEQLLSEEPVVTRNQLDFWRWMAAYYMSPLGDVYKAAFPGSMKKEKKRASARLLQAWERRGGCAEIQLPQLTSAQQDAYDAIWKSWGLPHDGSGALPQPGGDGGGLSICLLHGVTSSGKTEIYIHLIREMMAQGRQVLYLLPEIALTTQITERLRRVFGDDMGVYHSKFTDRQREEVYRLQLSDAPYRLILGVRSSVFLPFHRLGLVVVDEEHESSYKQQDPAPRYHARSAAIMLARQQGAKVLLGTATPSIETLHFARQHRYGYVRLTQRYADMQLPQVEVVDIARLKFQKRMKGAFSQRLLDEIAAALERKEQVILFQNRRGFSSFIQCRQCGWVPRCAHCDVSLTYHKRTNTLTCHYCGATYTLPEKCPQCEEQFTTVGAGTERIEEQIHRFFPEARTARLDLDTATTRKAYEQLINDFSAGDYDILIGTQMVTKGLDFDRVSLVGILDADTMLNQPDFRAYERTFQMLMQVAGRAGRKGRKGLVILQTRSADSPVVKHVVENDMESMFREQMEERTLFRYPPFNRLIYIYLRHRDVEVVNHAAEEFAALLRGQFGDNILGPDRPPVSRIASLHIRKIILKVGQEASVTQTRRLLLGVQQQMQQKSYCANLNIYYDVDPM